MNRNELEELEKRHSASVGPRDPRSLSVRELTARVSALMGWSTHRAVWWKFRTEPCAYDDANFLFNEFNGTYLTNDDDWPKYASDLNAMHKAVDTLSDAERVLYVAWLHQFCPDNTTEACAADRAMAFVCAKDLRRLPPA